MNPKPDHADVRVPPPLYYAVGFALGAVLHRTVGHDRFPKEVVGPARTVGWVMGAIGLLIDVYAVVRFRFAHTSLLPIRPTTTIVTAGPYRFTRNPMYLGLALLYLGIALVVGYAWPLVFLPFVVLAVDRFVISREERYLEEKFGEAYRRYCKSVHRWL